ncbi:MAG: hypothetical protein U0X75_26625 [Acidobacteriota bacterium]
MQKDLMGTVRKVAQLGYEVVEFYSPYTQWTTDYAKEVRKLLDELKIKCLSTHNSANVFTPENLPKAIELNQIIGSKTLVMASAGRVEGGLDGWKGVAAKLTAAQEKLKPLGMRAGFHNHKTEFMPIDGKRPMDILAANTPKDVTLHLTSARQSKLGWQIARLDQRHPTYSFTAFERLDRRGQQTRQRLPRVVWRRRRTVEGNFQSRRSQRGRGILPDGAGRQPVLFAGNGGKMHGDLQEDAQLRKRCRLQLVMIVNRLKPVLPRPRTSIEAAICAERSWAVCCTHLETSECQRLLPLRNASMP